MTAQRVTPEAVVQLLERSRVPGPTGVAFDADGTLWSGDVGEDTFEFACAHGLLREDATDHLMRVAADHGLAAAGSASAIAKRIYEAYRAGVVPELTTCEVMTWSYAGFTTDEVSALAREALTSRGLVARARRLLDPIFEFVRRERVRMVVVSASPRPIVNEGLRLIGLEVDAVTAAESLVVDGKVQPALSGRVPYGPQKPVAGGEVLASHDWLASFGDNAFDVEMLRVARIGVAVCPKPALVARLGELTNTVVLE
jgi:phosphatidylglycerophosphatase C